MKIMLSAAISISAVAILGTATVAPAQEKPKAAGEQVTVVGCVQREADYRRAQDKGRGGVAGTGLGVENEYVLTNVSSSAAARTTASDTAYELTGSNEKMVEKYVGRRVEISGRVKAAEVSATGRPTGGGTAGTPPKGVDVASKDLRLRELEVTTVRETTGTCPP